MSTKYTVLLKGILLWIIVCFKFSFGVNEQIAVRVTV